jgi:FkbM family methyltransferase
MGFFSLLAAEANPAIPIIAIEASSENAKVCLQNVEKTKRTNIEVRHGTFGKTKTFPRFQTRKASDNVGLSGQVNAPTSKIEKVRSITGDELGVPDGKRVLIKIGVEGHELEALRSLEKVLRASSSPRILLELNTKILRRARVKTSKVTKLLFSWGFRLFLIDDEKATWREIFSGQRGLQTEIGQGFRNLYCVKKTEAVSAVAFLHLDLKSTK